MSSDPGDSDDESAALRARLDRLKGDLKGRAAPTPMPQQKSAPKSNDAGSAMSLGLRVGSEFVSAVILGLGIGWVSILEPDDIRAALDVSASWTLVAYLCIGRPVEEHLDPELDRYRWQERLDVSKMIFKR